jgi:DeoR family transcriptional regulator, suf operon transcriptional repressor
MSDASAARDDHADPSPRHAQRSLLSGMSGRVLTLLCGGRRTVNELAAELQLTDNAVRAQLDRLQGAGLVAQAGSRPGTRKPHADYEITPAARRLFPTAYEPVLNQLLRLLAHRLPPDQVLTLLADAGEQLLAPVLGPSGNGSPRQRLTRLVEKLGPAGAGLELREHDGHLAVRACGCPLASVTADHPQLCDRLASVLTRLLGAPVTQACDRSDFPKCRFEIAPGRSNG